MHAVESLQLNGVVVLNMTMPYYYRQHLLAITLSLWEGDCNSMPIIPDTVWYLGSGKNGLLHCMCMCTSSDKTC